MRRSLGPDELRVLRDAVQDAGDRTLQTAKDAAVMPGCEAMAVRYRRDLRVLVQLADDLDAALEVLVITPDPAVPQAEDDDDDRTLPRTVRPAAMVGLALLLAAFPACGSGSQASPPAATPAAAAAPVSSGAAPGAAYPGVHVVETQTDGTSRHLQCPGGK